MSITQPYKLNKTNYTDDGDFIVNEKTKMLQFTTFRSVRDSHFTKAAFVSHIGKFT